MRTKMSVIHLIQAHAHKAAVGAHRISSNWRADISAAQSYSAGQKHGKYEYERSASRPILLTNLGLQSTFVQPPHIHFAEAKTSVM